VIELADAVALSVWPAIPRRRLARMLDASRRRAASGTDVPDADTDPATGVLEHEERSSRPASRLEMLLRQLGEAGEARARARELGESAVRAIEAAARHHISPIAFGDGRYPPLLAAIPDPPVVLWVRGHIEILARAAVAIVGSRAASAYGLEMAQRLAMDTCGHGLVVVSGLARGVDSAAHRGALTGGGATVAVLGSGADVIYPPEHRPLADEITDRGAVVSEFPPGTPPLAHHFPLRNRIISGLSLAVVVIEAAERSGSLITAECALEQGREVMAVPGSVLNRRNGGSHGLLRDGARLVESAADVLDEIGVTPMQALTDHDSGSEAHPLLGFVTPGEAFDPDALVRASGLDAPAVLSALLGLEMSGVIRRVDGGRFVRCERTC
jgi:DNA processing protein